MAGVADRGRPRVLATFPEDLSAMARKQLEEIGVEVWNNKHVTEVGPGFVKIGEERIDSVVTLWAAGVAPPL
jgi:NADH dehydrogenase